MLVSRAMGLQGGLGLVREDRPELGKVLGLSTIGSEESLQDMKQVTPRADVYVRSLTRTPNVRG